MLLRVHDPDGVVRLTVEDEDPARLAKFAAALKSELLSAVQEPEPPTNPAPTVMPSSTSERAELWQRFCELLQERAPQLAVVQHFGQFPKPLTVREIAKRLGTSPTQLSGTIGAVRKNAVAVYGAQNGDAVISRLRSGYYAAGPALLEANSRSRDPTSSMSFVADLGMLGASLNPGCGNTPSSCGNAAEDRAR